MIDDRLMFCRNGMKFSFEEEVGRAFFTGSSLCYKLTCLPAYSSTKYTYKSVQMKNTQAFILVPKLFFLRS